MVCTTRKDDKGGGVATRVLVLHRNIHLVRQAYPPTGPWLEPCQASRVSHKKNGRFRGKGGTYGWRKEETKE